MYNIYFKIKFTFINVPKWIQLFYNSNFELEVFKVENEQMLREEYIKNYVNNSSVDLLYGEIKYMLHAYKKIFRSITIHRDFPRIDLVNIFRPYVYLYIMSMDSIDGSKKKIHQEIYSKRF